MTRPVILFACREGDGRPTALRRAAELSRVLDCELFVTCVLPPSLDERVRGFISGRAGALPAEARARAAERHAGAWITDVLGDGANPPRVDVRGGAFVAQVARRACEVGAGLIVVPDEGIGIGHAATRLAHATSVPVLVGREGAMSGVIVAATDLRDPDLPVLRHAAILARRLSVPVLALHNVAPMVSRLGGEAPGTAPVMTASGLTEIRTQMRKGVRGAAIDANAIVANESRIEWAILQAARRRHADIIAVGTRRRSWFSRIVDRSVGEQVVDGARRSVLLIPLAGPTTGVQKERDEVVHGPRAGARSALIGAAVFLLLLPAGLTCRSRASRGRAAGAAVSGAQGASGTDRPSVLGHPIASNGSGATAGATGRSGAGAHGGTTADPGEVTRPRL